MKDEIVLRMSEREAFFLNVYLRSQIQRINDEFARNANLKALHLRSDLEYYVAIQVKLERRLREIESDALLRR